MIKYIWYTIIVISMNIDKIRSDVSNEILYLFEDVSYSPRLNILDREELVQDIGYVSSKEDLVIKINELIGESLEVDPTAFEEERLLKLTAPVDINNEYKKVNQIREQIRNITYLSELPNISAERIRDPEDVEEHVMYKFVYIYQK